MINIQKMHSCVTWLLWTLIIRKNLTIFPGQADHSSAIMQYLRIHNDAIDHWKEDLKWHLMAYLLIQ